MRADRVLLLPNDKQEALGKIKAGTIQVPEESPKHKVII
jgi:hypothetical protein